MTPVSLNKNKKYHESVGRRKRATARVRLTPAAKMTYLINGRGLEDYFKTAEARKTVTDVFRIAGTKNNFEISVKLQGGGIMAQAEAVRHGLSRVLIDYDAN